MKQHSVVFACGICVFVTLFCGKKQPMHTIAVIGTGYVGLVSAACLARFGHRVTAYDTDAGKIARLQNGEVPFHEPGLQALISETTGRGTLSFVQDGKHAIRERDLVFIAVGTPVGPLGDADLRFVRQAAHDIARHATGDVVVVNKSTVPVETVDLVERVLTREGRPGTRFRVASNPEFFREGSAVHDFFHPDRIVIGTRDSECARILRELYQPLNAPVLIVSAHTSEMIKYAANAFLATKISFVNELANICASVGADIEQVLHGMSYDRRIGRDYMRPGIGFGGSCLPKDLSALAHVARAHAIEPTMLDAVLQVNRRQIASILTAIERGHGDLEGARIAVLGLSFKPHTDDVRASPALELIEALLARGADVRVHDPAALSNAHARLGGRVEYAQSPYEACAEADVVVIASAWPEYEQLDWRRVAASVRGTQVFDCVRILPAADVREAGLKYGAVSTNASDEELSA